MDTQKTTPKMVTPSQAMIKEIQRLGNEGKFQEAVKYINLIIDENVFDENSSKQLVKKRDLYISEIAKKKPVKDKDRDKAEKIEEVRDYHKFCENLLDSQSHIDSIMKSVSHVSVFEAVTKKDHKLCALMYHFFKGQLHRKSQFKGIEGGNESRLAWIIRVFNVEEETVLQKDDNGLTVLKVVSTVEKVGKRIESKLRRMKDTGAELLGVKPKKKISDDVKIDSDGNFINTLEDVEQGEKGKKSKTDKVLEMIERNLPAITPKNKAMFANLFAVNVHNNDLLFGLLCSVSNRLESDCTVEEWNAYSDKREKAFKIQEIEQEERLEAIKRSEARISQLS